MVSKLAVVLSAVFALSSGGCTKFAGEYDGEAVVTVLSTPAGSTQPVGVRDRKYGVHVSVRSGTVPVRKYPSGKLLIEIKGAPFERCLLNVYETSGGNHSMTTSHEDSCVVAVDGYTGEFPGISVLAFVTGDDLSIVANDPRTESAAGVVRGQLNLKAHRAH